MVAKLFTKPFGVAGDKTPIPNDTQVDGTVSYQTGFGADYERQLGVDPAAKNIARQTFNELMFDVTTSLQETQGGIGASPYSLALAQALPGGGYPKGALIPRLNGNGFWLCTTAANVTNPDTGGAGWTLLSLQGEFYAVDTGAANAVSCVFSPALTSRSESSLLAVKIKTTNTGASTINDGVGTVPIVLYSRAALQGGELTTNQVVLLQWVAAISSYVAIGVSYASATQVDAEAGTNTTRPMSALRVFQAIAKVVTQATETTFGWLKIATQTQTNNGLDDNTAVTPKKLGVTFQSQAFLAVTTTGTSTTYAIAPNYDAAPYAANQRFFITFHIASTGSPTLNASGRGNRPLMMYDSAGAKVPAVVQAGQMSDVVCDGINFIVLDQLPQSFTQDLWALQPVGALIALIDNGTVPAPPLGNANYTYIRLTAGDVYNAGLLTSESVTGVVPLVSATGVVTSAGSPFNGTTVRLINTERRVIRAGSPGVIEQDQFQGHSFGDPRLGAGYILSTPSAVNLTANSGADTGPVITRIDVNASGVQLATKTDGTNGTPRVGLETRVKSMGATYYMRIK